MRVERNEKIFRLLERIETRAAMLAAKTDRFNLLRKQYQAYLQRVYNVANENKPPRQAQVLDTIRLEPKIDILEKYMSSLPSQKYKDDILNIKSKIIPTNIHEKENKNAENELKTSNNYTLNKPEEYYSGSFENSNYPTYMNSLENAVESKDAENIQYSDTNLYTTKNNLKSFTNVEDLSPTKEKFNVRFQQDEESSGTAEEKADFEAKETDKQITDTLHKDTEETAPSEVDNVHVETNEEQKIDEGIYETQIGNLEIEPQPSNEYKEDTEYLPEDSTPQDEIVSEVVDERTEHKEQDDSTPQIMENTNANETILQRREIKSEVDIVRHAEEKIEETKSPERKESKSLKEEMIKLDEKPPQQETKPSPPPISDAYSKNATNDSMQVNPQQSQQPIKLDSNEKIAEQYNQSEQLNTNYDTNVHLIPQYDENGQLIPQYDANGQLIPQYDETGQVIPQYDAHGQLIPQYDENGHLIPQYDEHGQLIQHYDENGQLLQNYDPNLLYDEHGQLKYDPQMQYDEHGQPIGDYLQYDEHGQPIYDPNVHYDPNLQYDENGQPINVYDPNVQYDESGQMLQYDPNMQYDEKGQPIQYVDPKIEYNNEAQSSQQNNSESVNKNSNSKYNNSEPLSTSSTEQHINLQSKENKPEKESKVKEKIKQPNVIEMLDTDSESTKQDTKVSNESDFDFSNK